MRAVCAHTTACPVPPSEFRLRLSRQVVGRRQALVVRDARLVPHHSRVATDIFREVRCPVAVDHWDALNHRDEPGPAIQQVDSFATLPDEAARLTAVLPDALDIFVLAAARPQILLFQPTRSQVQAAQVEKPDCLERAGQAAAERPASERMARLQVLQEQRQCRPQELCLVSQLPGHAQVHLPEKKPEDAPPLREHQLQPELHQALQRHAPQAPQESFPEPQASPPLLQEQPAPPSQVLQARSQQARQQPGAPQGASPPWPSLASPLPPQLLSQPNLENVSAQVRPCRDRASSSVFSFP
jgi:hypothetical protein